MDWRQRHRGNSATAARLFWRRPAMQQRSAHAGQPCF